MSDFENCQNQESGNMVRIWNFQNPTSFGRDMAD